MITARLTPALLCLLLACGGGVMAQEVRAPNFITGKFRAVEGSSASVRNQTCEIYLAPIDVDPVTGLSPEVAPEDGALTILVHFKGKWFKLDRDSVDSPNFEGFEVESIDGITAESGGLAGALTGNGSSVSSASSSHQTGLKMFVDGMNNWGGEIRYSNGRKATFRLNRRTRIVPEMTSDTPALPAIQAHMDSAPPYPNEGDYERVYWDAWGPVFHRGRLDGSARMMCIASDPGPTEVLPFVRRSLVGDAGQRTQGFVNKLGLTRSYVMVNAFTYATRPSKMAQGRKVMRDFPQQLEWRNTYWDLIFDSSEIKGIMLFGGQAKKAFNAWKRHRKQIGSPLPEDLVVVSGMHPSAPRGGWSTKTNLSLAKQWREAVAQLREVVEPDDAEMAARPNYGISFTEADYGRVPLADLPAEALNYPWIGDDSWNRNGKPRRNNPTKRRGMTMMKFRSPAPMVGEMGILEWLNSQETSWADVSSATGISAWRAAFITNKKGFGSFSDVDKVRFVGGSTLNKLYKAAQFGGSIDDVIWFKVPPLDRDDPNRVPDYTSWVGPE